MREFRLDLQRDARIGLSEAVLCDSKPAQQLQAILDAVVDLRRPLLLTRLEPAARAELCVAAGQLDYDPLSRSAIYLPPDHRPASLREAGVTVVTGGSSDLSVAREAVRTLAFHGVAAEEVHDVGVAGLWRLQEELEGLRARRILLCVAGMDAALPTVLAGLVPGLVIAVPSSAGYGAARGGETALNALLCSCAQGVVVVNIDNGFGAACAALRALR